MSMYENPKRATIGLILIVTGAVLFSAWTLNPARFGSYHDDGIYVVTAKALATGQGYRIISLPGAPAQTKYPPLYAGLLSLVWRVNPNFPENLRWMMMTSVVTAAFFLIATYAYLVRRSYAARGTALLIVGLMACNFRLLILSNSLYSDLLYMLLSVLALWQCERYADDDRLWTGLGAGLLLGLAFLTRTMGITLLLSAALYFLIRRQFKKLMVVSAMSALLVVPWILWQKAHSAPAGPAMAYYTDYMADFRAHISDAHLMRQMIAKNLIYVGLVNVPTVMLGLEVDNYRQPAVVLIVILAAALVANGLLKRWRSGVRLPDLYVTVYGGLLLVWPYASSDRFIIPLLPFLLYYLISQLQFFLSKARAPAAGKALHRVAHALFALAALGLGIATAYGELSGLIRLIKYQEGFREYANRRAPVMAWIKQHTAPSDVILSYEDPTVYLHTGRRAVRLALLRIRAFYQDTTTIEEAEMAKLRRLMRDSGARYLVLANNDFFLDYQPELTRQAVLGIIREAPDVFTPVYETPRPFANIYRIAPAPDGSGIALTLQSNRGGL